MPVEFKDKMDVDIEPGDKVRITFEVTVETVEGTIEGATLTYADRERGRMVVKCSEVVKTASRV